MIRPASLLILIPLAIGGNSGCSNVSTQAPALAASVPDHSAIPAVAVATPTFQPLVREVVLSGEFRPHQVSELHAKVAGYLREITVDVGSVVKEGQVLATLEIPEMEAELAQVAAETQRAEAEQLRAEVEIERAQANLKLQSVSYSRLAQAAGAEPGLIAQQEIDEAIARRAAAEAQVASAKAALAVEHQRVAAGKAVERRARVMSAYMRIVAPFSGVITKRYADPGAMIQAGTASQTQAMPLVRLAEISTLRLVVTAPESVVPLIRPGQHVTIRVVSLNRELSGVVSRLTRDVLSASRTMEAEIDVANRDGAVSPGMYAEVGMSLEKRERALTIPVTAISNSGGNRSVYVVSPAGTIEDRAIKTGIESADRLEVLSGLEARDRVVIGNRALLRPGQKVEPKLSGDN